jgi:tellurite methyltransferase
MLSDKEKWDKRYSQDRPDIPEPDSFLVNHIDLFSGGRAIDVACGLGGNSIYLAERGFTVDAADISLPALKSLRRHAECRGLPINTILADLDYFSLRADFYDLAVIFYFYSERILAEVKETVKKGGIVVYATYNKRHLSIKPTFNPDYLIDPEQPVRAFSDWEILVSEPVAGENGNISRIIARKPD